MLSTICTVTYAKELSNNVEEAQNIALMPSALEGETLHKINGIGMENGGSGNYTSTIKRTCNTIKVQGTCLGSTSDKSVVVTVYPDTNHLRPVAYGKVLLDGRYHELTTLYVTEFSPGTYYIEVQPYFSCGYECSTYFYY